METWYLRICQINILINLFFRFPEVYSCMKSSWTKILGLYYRRCSQSTAFTELRFSVAPNTQILVEVAKRNGYLNHLFLSLQLVKIVYFFPQYLKCKCLLYNKFLFEKKKKNNKFLFEFCGNIKCSFLKMNLYAFSLALLNRFSFVLLSSRKTGPNVSTWSFQLTADLLVTIISLLFFFLFS